MGGGDDSQMCGRGAHVWKLVLSWFRNARPAAKHTPATKMPELATTKQARAASGPLVPSAAARLSQDADPTDYLGTPAVAAYFDAREHEAYYRALKRVGLRRDFHERLIPVLERFIEFTDFPPGATVVDRIIAGSLRVQEAARAPTGGSPLDLARARYPEGIRLLNIIQPLTFDSLKAAYRNAVRRNHPDAGGSHEAMVAVNEVFHFTHALLCEREIQDGIVESQRISAPDIPEVRNCLDYRYSCGELLFLVTLDDWNVDGALLWLERITSGPWRQSSYAQHSWRRIALTEPAGKLAIRLSLAGLREPAAQALAVAREGLQGAQDHQLSYERFVPDLEDILAGRRRIQVVINHKRQATNALRLGIIDPKRHQKIVERLTSSDAIDDLCEEHLRQFEAEGGFLNNLPTDHIAHGRISPRQLVPEPGYFVNRIEQLTNEQQAEYLIAFSNRGTLSLVQKYTFVRLVSLLESVLLYPGQVDDAAAEREARELA
jgi:hypothetical protein